MTTYLFPGQGSQRKGMGAELFSYFPDIINQANDILGYSIKKICLEDPDNQLNQTQFTQPILYVVNALSYFKKIQDGAALPESVIGHSLGEYNALLAAQVFDFTTGLRLVQKRSELMSQAKNGAMAAILGLGAVQLLEELQRNNLSNVVIANYNSYTQNVISGLSADIEKAQNILERSNALVIPLKVSGAFHSPLLFNAEIEFITFLENVEFTVPIIPVIANVDARPYEKNNLKIKLARQITGSIQWYKSIEYRLDQGEQIFEEVGPGQVLTNLLKQILKSRVYV